MNKFWTSMSCLIVLAATNGKAAPSSPSLNLTGNASLDSQITTYSIGLCGIEEHGLIADSVFFQDLSREISSRLQNNDIGQVNVDISSLTENDQELIDSIKGKMNSLLPSEKDSLTKELSFNFKKIDTSLVTDSLKDCEGKQIQVRVNVSVKRKSIISFQNSMDSILSSQNSQYAARFPDTVEAEGSVKKVFQLMISNNGNLDSVKLKSGEETVSLRDNQYLSDLSEINYPATPAGIQVIYQHTYNPVVETPLPNQAENIPEPMVKENTQEDKNAYLKHGFLGAMALFFLGLTFLPGAF